jgi:hypothetical protein
MLALDTHRIEREWFPLSLETGGLPIYWLSQYL